MEYRTVYMIFYCIISTYNRTLDLEWVLMRLVWKVPANELCYTDCSSRSWISCILAWISWMVTLPCQLCGLYHNHLMVRSLVRWMIIWATPVPCPSPTRWLSLSRGMEIRRCWSVWGNMVGMISISCSSERWVPQYSSFLFQNSWRMSHQHCSCHRYSPATKIRQWLSGAPHRWEVLSILATHNYLLQGHNPWPYLRWCLE